MNQPFDQVRAGFFDNLAQKWDERSIVPADDVIEDVLNKLNIVSGDIVLDVGTGTGLLVPFIMKYRPSKVIAMDISGKMLQRLAVKYQNCYGAKLETLCNDVHCMKIDDASVDVAICNGVFPHFNDKPKALSELHRVLRTGGRLTVNHFTNRETINAIHASSAHQLIREDILDDVQKLAILVKEQGFIVRETVDNEKRFFLLAMKPR